MYIKLAYKPSQTFSCASCTSHPVVLMIIGYPSAKHKLMLLSQWQSTVYTHRTTVMSVVMPLMMMDPATQFKEML